MASSASTPTPRPTTVGHDGRASRGDSMRWVRTALARQETLVSPLASAGKLAEHAEELTPCTELLANESLKRLLHFPSRAREMKKEDAVRCLRVAISTVETRAAKLALDAAAAAQAEDARKLAKGAAVAGKRAASARQARASR